MDTIKEKALVLRTCKSDMTSRNGFVWPNEGPVECHDWVASDECGNGLHGALWGEGDGALFYWDDTAAWQVVEIEEYINLDGKVKFPRGIVKHTGDRFSATAFIQSNGAKGAVIGGTATVGYQGTATAGYKGTATAGYYGTATAGYYGILQIAYYDGRRRIATAYVGENGILPNVKYKLDVNGRFVKA